MVTRILLLILHKTDFLKGGFLCFIPFIGAGSTDAQTVHSPLSSLYTQVLSYSSLQGDAISVHGNQAALATVKKFSAGIYSERRFMLEELAQYTAVFSLPTSGGNFGLIAGYAGSQLYNETQIGLAYGRNIGKLNIGARFNYFQVMTGGYGSVPSVNFEIGAILKPTDQLNAGFHVYNPTGSRMGKNKEERLPTIFSTGFGYDVSKQFFLGCRVEKTEDQPVTVNVCMQYCFAEKLFARTGISTATSSFYFGAGFLLDQFRIDATATWHQQLGLSPGIMFIYNGVKN